MHRAFWLVNHPGALFGGAMVIALFAWPLEYLPALIVAGVMMAAAVGIAARAHFYPQQG